MTNHIPSRPQTIQTTLLDAVTGGAVSDAAFQRFVDDSSKTTQDRLRLVDNGQLDREDFNYLLGNQKRMAKVLVDGAASRRQ